MRILITGAYGFIGKHLISALLADPRSDKAEIYTVSRSKQAQIPRINCLQYDLLNSEYRKELIEKVKPSHLIHMAWEANYGYQQTPKNIDWLNSSIHLLELFHLYKGQVFCACGTLFEYANNNKVCKEYTSPCIPLTPYANCKLALSAIVEAYSQLYKTRSLWLRLPYITGTNDHDYKLVNQVFDSFKNNIPFKCNTPKMKVDYLDVRDVAKAITDCFFSDLSGIINIGSGQVKTVLELIEIMANIFDKKVNIILSKQEEEPKGFVLDIERLTKEVGFKPKYSIDECFMDIYKNL